MNEIIIFQHVFNVACVGENPVALQKQRKKIFLRAIERANVIRKFYLKVFRTLKRIRTEWERFQSKKYTKILFKPYTWLIITEADMQTNGGEEEEQNKSEPTRTTAFRLVSTRRAPRFWAVERVDMIHISEQ